MAYTQDEKSTGLDALTSLSGSDLHIVGDVSDGGRAKAITQDNLEVDIANSTNFIDELTDNSTFITNINTIAPSPLTTKGDLYTYSTESARLPVGTDGQVVVADSAETTGLKWIDVPFGGAGGVKIDIDTNESSVTGTTSKTAIFTIPIPAGTIGTNDALQFEFVGSSDGSTNITIDFGGQTASVLGSGSPGNNIQIRGQIVADNSTSAQKSSAAIFANVSLVERDYAALTVDSTVSQNLVISATNALSGDTTTGQYIIVTKISASGSNDNEIATLIPLPQYIFDTAGNIPLASNTLAKVGMFRVENPITVSDFSIYMNTVNTPGDMKVGIYTEDGQTKLFEETFAITTGGVYLETLGSPVTLERGNYYCFALSISTANLLPTGYQISNTNLAYEISGRSTVAGQMTVTANTLPTTFDPETDVQHVDNAGGMVLIRFDA